MGEDKGGIRQSSYFEDYWPYVGELFLLKVISTQSYDSMTASMRQFGSDGNRGSGKRGGVL